MSLRSSSEDIQERVVQACVVRTVLQFDLATQQMTRDHVELSFNALPKDPHSTCVSRYLMDVLCERERATTVPNMHKTNTSPPFQMKFDMQTAK